MKKFLFTLPLAVLILTGCVIKIKTSNSVDGGIYKSVDRGDNWQQVSQVYRVAELPQTFSTVDLTVMAIDPSDSQAIYLGTQEEGMYYTYDGGKGWQRTLTGKGKINAIAVSLQERCIVYAAILNKVYKTTDCSRHWNYQLIETRDDPDNQITSLAIDDYNTQVIYVGTSGKGLFKSQDGGLSWQVIKFFDDRIAQILVNPRDSRIIYLATREQGIFKTVDRGENWQPLFSQEMIKEKKDLLVYREFILDPTVEDGLLYASPYGLLRSADGGATWQELKLLTPPSTTTIYSLAINPHDGQEIYYGTAKALFKSQDGGQNWITRSLPSTRAAKFLLIDPSSPNVLYLGMKKVK